MEYQRAIRLCASGERVNIGRPRLTTLETTAIVANYFLGSSKANLNSAETFIISSTVMSYLLISPDKLGGRQWQDFKGLHPFALAEHFGHSDSPRECQPRVIAWL